MSGNHPVDALRVSIYGLWLQTRNNFGRDSIQLEVRKLISDWLEGVKKANLLPDSETATVRGQLAASEQVRIRQAHQIVELEQEVERLKSGDYSAELQEKNRQIEGLSNLVQACEDTFTRNFPGKTVEQVKARLQLLEEIETRLSVAANPAASIT